MHNCTPKPNNFWIIIVFLYNFNLNKLQLFKGGYKIDFIMKLEVEVFEYVQNLSQQYQKGIEGTLLSKANELVNANKKKKTC